LPFSWRRSLRRELHEDGVLRNQTQPDLHLGTEFRWKTFGVTIDSTVLEFVRHERLAWDAHCNGMHDISCVGVRAEGCWGVCADRGDAERLADTTGCAGDAGKDVEWHQRCWRVGQVAGREE